MPIGVLCLLRGHQRVASVRQRSGSIRSSIHMLHIRPPKAEETWGALSGKESKTQRQQSITPANTRRRTNRCIVGCCVRRRPCSPTLASWWPYKVASPGLGGGQVAGLYLHADSVGHVTNAPYSYMR